MHSLRELLKSKRKRNNFWENQSKINLIHEKGSDPFEENRAQHGHEQDHQYQFRPPPQRPQPPSTAAAGSPLLVASATTTRRRRFRLTAGPTILQFHVTLLEPKILLVGSIESHLTPNRNPNPSINQSISPIKKTQIATIKTTIRTHQEHLSDCGDFSFQQ